MNRRSLFVLAASLVVSGSLFAASPAQNAAQVAVDKNGNLRQPTQAEQRVLIEQAQATARPSILRLEPKAHGNGMVSIALDESFDHAFVVRTDADGSIVFACTSHDEAAQFVAETASLDTILRIKPAGVAKRTAERE
jgi:endoglucanase Acf2